MEEWSYSAGFPFAARSISGAAELERCYHNRWINEPERNLMLAVLEDAIRCYLGYREGDTSARNRLAFADARDWINSRSRYSIFAFRNLCEIIGINPDSLKRELNRIRRNSRSRTVSLQRTFDVRNPSVAGSRSGTNSARTRRPRAPKAAQAVRSRSEMATIG
jgi:hypothetical protein